MRWRVVCALREVMLIFWPTSALSSVRLADVGPADDRDQAAALGGFGQPARRVGQSVRFIAGSSGPQRAARPVAGLQRVEHAPRGLLLGRAARTALAGVRQAAAPAPRTRPRRSARAPGRACATMRYAGHRQPARLQPLLQLGLRVLGPAVDLGGGDHLAEQRSHQRLRAARSRRRGRRHRSSLRAHRPGSTAAARRRRAPRLRTGAARRADPATARRGAGCLRARDGRARASGRLRRSRRSARTAAPRSRGCSTASPRNSSRSLWSAPKLRCVSARVSRPASAKR